MNDSRNPESDQNPTVPSDSHWRYQSTSDDIGKLLLRVSVAVLMLFHGVAKTRNGVGGIDGMLEDTGWPTVLAYGVYIGEVLAPILILVGAFTRISSLLLAFNMLGAIYVGHREELLT